MRILVVLMFLVSGHGFSMGLTDHETQLNRELPLQLPQEPRSEFAEFVESASPACQEIAFKLQECKGVRGGCALWSDHDGRSHRTLLKLPYRCVVPISACQIAGVSVEKYLLCERKEMQRQLQEIQDKLKPFLDAASQELGYIREKDRWPPSRY